jgi:SAM-dependent methyltransferase
MQTDTAVAIPRELDSAACLVCGAPLSGAPQPINDGWSMVVCRVCDAGITTPIPSADDLVEFNAGFYEPSIRAATYRSRRAEFKDRWDDLLAFGAPGRPIGSLLDVGCSLGFFVAHARDRGISRAAGIEINAACRDWGRAKLGIDVRASWQDFGDERFDLVVLMDVVEHVLDPIGLMHSAAGLLRPDGRLIIQAPNRRSDMARRAGRRWSWYSAPDHVIHLAPASLTVLAERAGLEVIALRTGDVAADYLIDALPAVPARAIAALRHLPRIRSLRVRDDSRGGLLQAVLARAAR